MPEEKKVISISDYANAVAGQQIIIFNRGIYIPVAIGWDGDPTILIAKRISEFTLEKPVEEKSEGIDMNEPTEEDEGN